MYASLHFSPGWVSNTADIAKAIISLACGSSLASLAANELSTVPLFNLSKSSRRAVDANHFWIKDTDNICHAPCDTLTGQNKYFEVTSVSSNMPARLGNNVNFTRFSTKYVLRTASDISNSAPLVVHMICTKRFICIGVMNEGSVRTSTMLLVSELTYDRMPYMDDSTGEFIPAVIGEFGFTPLIIGNSSETGNPFACPYIIGNTTTGGTPGATGTLTWRIGNANAQNRPLTTTLGNTRLDPATLTSVEAFLNVGVSCLNQNTIFQGSITDKTGIMIMNGVGHPADLSNSGRYVPTDSMLEINGQNYLVFDKFVVPYV